MELSDEIYPGSFHSLVRTFDKRRKKLRGVEKALPKSNVDLATLKSEIVSTPSNTPEDFEKGDVRSKQVQLQAEFAGRCELLYLHGFLIAVLRRLDPPADASRVFMRLWKEHGDYLAGELNTRWKISAATTFADHGTTLEQRSLGMGLSILFDTIKMHDSERRITGQPGRKPFSRNREARHFPLAFDMEPYSFKKGDLDRNMLARLWSLAEQDEVIYPLARSMLFQIMTDRRSIFARLQRMKPKKPDASIFDFLPGG